jgi:hypothetical protein
MRARESFWMWNFLYQECLNVLIVCMREERDACSAQELDKGNDYYVVIQAFNTSISARTPAM